MIVETELFPHTWTAELLDRPPLIAPARQFVYPQQVAGEEETLGRGALFLQVKPVTGGSFLATCALGFSDPSLPSGLWACPAADDLLVIAGGYAYRVRTSNPAACEFLELRPVASVLPDVEGEQLLLAGFHHVLSLGAEGVRWQTGRLSWEGVSMTTIRGGELEGTGWDMFTDREVPFTVDLRDGTHSGGGYRR